MHSQYIFLNLNPTDANERDKNLKGNKNYNSKIPLKKKKRKNIKLYIIYKDKDYLFKNRNMENQILEKSNFCFTFYKNILSFLIETIFFFKHI